MKEWHQSHRKMVASVSFIPSKGGVLSIPISPTYGGMASVPVSPIIFIMTSRVTFTISFY